MTCRAVIGLQWGDEGKGKVVDLLASRADLVVRYQGGANAGHTVVVGAKSIVSHLVPSGAFHPRTACVIGAGVALDPVYLLEEVDLLAREGIDLTARLWVSERAHLVLGYHKALDSLSESTSGNLKIGTTGRGIGPCYADKMGRTGVRVADLYDREILEPRIHANVARANALLVSAGVPPFDADAILSDLARVSRRLQAFVRDTEAYVVSEAAKGREILFEGAQGTLLDVDLGTYPYVTSSNPGTSGIPSGAGVPLRTVDRCLGVTKAYTTRVGEGPFPTELDDSLGNRLREIGSEYGATTGRPRRIGWLDGVALRYAVRVNGVDGMAVMKLDCLAGIGPLRICRAYEIDGKPTEEFPAGLSALRSALPIYETLPGFEGDLGQATRLDQLPEEARAFLERVREIAGVPIQMVSVGPDRRQTIELG